eukprot:1147694-Pelagomonas_calceolata.AAC.13
MPRQVWWLRAGMQGSEWCRKLKRSSSTGADCFERVQGGWFWWGLKRKRKDCASQNGHAHQGKVP